MDKDVKIIGPYVMPEYIHKLVSISLGVVVSRFENI